MRILRTEYANVRRVTDRISNLNHGTNMKKKLLLIMTTLVVAILTGCSAVQTANPHSFNGLKLSPDGKAIAHISGFANGIYFLCFPLITGSTENIGSIDFFKDTITVTELTSAVTKEASMLEADTTIDLASSTTSTSFVVPPIPYPLFSWKSVYVSGNAIKK